jgi:hypothetical protein
VTFHARKIGLCPNVHRDGGLGGQGACSSRPIVQPSAQKLTDHHQSAASMTRSGGPLPNKTERSGGTNPAAYRVSRRTAGSEMRPQASRGGGRGGAATMSDKHEVTGMYELFDAIETIISASDAAKREELARTIDAYARDFPGEFSWAIGPQAPVLLHRVLTSIDLACRPPSQSRPRPTMRLVDRKSD